MGVGDHIHFIPVKEGIDHGADQHLIRCRGADSGSADDVAGDKGVKAADPVPHLLKAH